MSRSLFPQTLLSYKNDIFVETGTCDASVMEMALLAGFKKIKSIELDDALAKRGQELWKHSSMIEIIHGNSGLILGDVIRDIDVPITFWLDAHPEPWNPEAYNPLLDELRHISKHPIKTHTILIDDRRMMGSSSPTWSGTDEDSVMAILDIINPKYKISYVNSKNGYDDIIVARI